VPIGKLAQKRNVVVCHLSVRPRRSVRSADCGGPEECASDLHSRRIAPARKELRNGSSKSEREPTHSTNCGSGHVIRVFRDIGRIFSLLFLLSHPSPVGSFAFRNASGRQGLAVIDGEPAARRSGAELRTISDGTIDPRSDCLQKTGGPPSCPSDPPVPAAVPH
jgi:hypothetical protein